VNYAQLLICKRISVGTPSAEGARIEARREVECGERCPLPTGRGLWGGGYAKF